MEFTVKGKVVNVLNKTIIDAEILIKNGKIEKIIPASPSSQDDAVYIIPGFIDAHVHIESSMLIPAEFAKLAVVHGSVATVSDPHEIANVCGMKGVEFMIANGKTVPFKFNFGAPSCVPATTFETAGDELNADDIDMLLQKNEVKYLSEMMNFPGVLFEDKEVMKKLALAKKWNKPIDGHAPGLRGEDAKKYIAAGPSTDHECFTREEAEEKLKYGMKILIREGSAAKNFDALIDLLEIYPDKIMFCSDDKHPDSLVDGHINTLCKRAIEKGIDIFKVLQAACVNPVQHYNLQVGQLIEGDAADFVVIKDLKKLEVLQTYIDGILVAENGISLIKPLPLNENEIVNKFDCTLKQLSDFEYKKSDTTFSIDGKIPVIEALDGQLITNKLWLMPKIINGLIVSDVQADILKMVVVNRYNSNMPVAKALIKNFGLKSGAIASSVAHDSHNIVAVGTDDESICRAVNAIINCNGGISCVNATETVLPLPVAGLMSINDGYEVAKQYTQIDKKAKALGSTLSAPFMTLSFMALLVIPHLKLSDKGLFDGDTFELL